MSEPWQRTTIKDLRAQADALHLPYTTRMSRRDLYMAIQEKSMEQAKALADERRIEQIAGDALRVGGLDEERVGAAMEDWQIGRENVFRAVQRVLGDMPAIGKNSNAPQNMGGYAFRSIEDITAALKPLLAKHGVVMVPTVIERRDNERPVGNNKTMHVVDLHVRFTFYGADGSTFDATMWGQGTDMGDKSPQKAVTSAFKSMLAVTFCISDSESDAEGHDVPDTERAPEPEDAWAASRALPDNEPVHDDTGTCCKAVINERIAVLPEFAREMLRDEWKRRGLTRLDRLRDADRANIDVLLSDVERAVRDMTEGDENVSSPDDTNATVGKNFTRPAGEAATVESSLLNPPCDTDADATLCPACGISIAVENRQCGEHPF